jgi:hypothetical protein
MTPLIKKLRLLPGQQAQVLNAPPGYIESLEELPEGIVLVEAPEEGSCDFVHLFVKDRAEFAAFGLVATRAIKYDGVLWISYPKGSSKVKTDLNRDSMWELLADIGWRPVTQISIDDTWSAMRFRPAERVNVKA